MPIKRKDNLAKIKASIPGAIRNGLLAGGNEAVTIASNNAPVETGALSNSGRVEVNSDTSVTISFGNGLPDERAPAQEFGTIFTEAQPFIRPAIKQTKFEEHLARSINKVLK